MKISNFFNTKSFLSVITLLLFLFTSSYGQEINQITLDNYSYSPDQTFVGTILLSDSRNEFLKIKLKGKNRSKFSIVNGNQLHFVKGNAGSGLLFYDISILGKTKIGKIKNQFRIVKDEFIRNGVVAHRGAWKNQGVSPNSMGALNNAMMLGCEGSEFDIWLTKDGLPIISHDPQIGGKIIKESTGTEITNVPLKNGEFVPTLEDYLKSVMTQNKTRLFLEIKPFNLTDEELMEVTRKAVGMVHDLKAQAWVEYISFGYDVVKEIKRLDPTSQQAYLGGEKTVDDLKKDAITGLDFHYSFFVKYPNLINQAKSAGITTNFWTINDEKAMLQLILAGVDYITTDEPELLLRLKGDRE